MYVVIGANGFLGSYIIKTALEQTKEQILACCRDTKKAFMRHERLDWLSADIENPEDTSKIFEAMRTAETPCKVAYLAACHHPDVVERNPGKAWHTNITCLSAFLEKTENMKCLFYPSTDSVYGESEGGIHLTEDASLAPVNTYGVQKATAEAVVRGFGCNVVRYPFLIAPSLLTHKKHFYDQIVETLKRGERIEMFSDSVRSSLDFETAAKLLVQLMDGYSGKMPKTLNLSGDEDLSKYDIGLMIAKKINVDSNLVIPILSGRSEGIFEAKRAKSTLLDNAKVKRVLGLSEIHLTL